MEILANFLSEAELAEKTGKSRYTIARWRKSGRFPHYRLGAKVYVKVADIETFLESCRVESPAASSKPTRKRGSR